MANPYAKRNRNNGPPGRFRNNNGGGGNNSNRNNNGGGGNNNGGGPRFGGYNNRSGGNNNRNNNNNNNRNNNRNNNNNRGGNGNNNNNSNGGGGGGPNADVMKTLLRLLFEKNPSLDPNTGMLDVSNMRGAPDLQAVSKTVDFNNVSFCKSLAEVLRDVYGNNIRLLMLSRNDIRKLTPFLSALMQVDIHQNITAIAAMDNAVNDLSFIAPLKQYPMLNEILLTGNPVCSTKEYRPQITRSLPNLTLLDGEPVFRPMLTMPNPVAPGRTPEEESMALQLAQFVDVNLLQPMMYGHAVEAIEQQISQAYAPEGMLSLSRAAEPLPRNVPFSATHNNADLDKSMKNAMQTDFASLKQGIRWRNLSSDVQSMREIARGQRDIVKKLKDYIGTNKSAISVQVAVNEYYNVAAVEANMKVPVILVTVHGKIKYMWNPHPPNSAGASGIFQQGREPFISTFFDRTVSLIYRENRFFVVNDMIFCRPDRTVVHDNGTPSSELFFAGNPERVELMRRRLLPSGSFDVMNFIMFNSQNDATVQQYAARCANELSPEQQQSVDAVRGLLGI